MAINTTPPNPPNGPRKSKAILRLEALREKESVLAQKRAEAEAIVAREDHAAEIAQGLIDFVALIGQKEPDEIEGIVSMAIPVGAPAGKVASVEKWTGSLKAAALARRAARLTDNAGASASINAAPDNALASGEDSSAAKSDEPNREGGTPGGERNGPPKPDRFSPAN